MAKERPDGTRERGLDGRSAPSDSVMRAEIEAGVRRQRDRLRFVLLLAVVGSSAYVVRQAIVTPAEDPPSVRCMKAGGVWQPEYHDVKGYEIKAFCTKGATVVPQPPPPEAK